MHEYALLDLLSALRGIAYRGPVWRVVRSGRSATEGSRGAGRWNTINQSVLYCSEDATGAVSEVFFHLNRGQSVFPSRMQHNLIELDVISNQTLELLDMAQ